MARGGFPGMMGGGNMQQLARQAQKLQQQMTKVQEELDAREYEASAGGGMVTVKVSGKKELLSIEIKPEAVDPDDVEMLQDMVLAAVNEALRTANDTTEREMGKLTGGLNMPGLF
ncbi:MAG: YbaB/EbfC family nucleoid-associated protein [Clostridia bacterium]|nr:YbaB/EbfC family nucleoid-associated protein [Clostridia bacterium]MBR6889924.1 YbaB/EbfC family nucleoid-associated protein [Clostridia bacterium]